MCEGMADSEVRGPLYQYFPIHSGTRASKQRHAPLQPDAPRETSGESEHTSTHPESEAATGQPLHDHDLNLMSADDHCPSQDMSLPPRFRGPREASLRDSYLPRSRSESRSPPPPRDHDSASRPTRSPTPIISTSSPVPPLPVRHHSTVPGSRNTSPGTLILQPCTPRLHTHRRSLSCLVFPRRTL